jgi:hypothetical protein
MQRAFWKSLLLAAAAVVMAAGCDNDLGVEPEEDPPTVTDTFTGTVNPNGAQTHTFTLAVAGTVTATLTEVTPDPNIAVGFALGTWNSTSSICQQSIPNDNAVQGHILTGTVTGPVGTLCTRIYDTGKLTGSISYTITVVHP